MNIYKYYDENIKILIFNDYLYLKKCDENREINTEYDMSEKLSSSIGNNDGLRKIKMLR